MRAEQLFDGSLAFGPLAQALREAPCFVTEEDLEDFYQEAMVALWQAARGYGESGTAMPFAEYAGVHIRATLREYMARWYADAEFSPSAGLDEVVAESVFLLWPDDE